MSSQQSLHALHLVPDVDKAGNEYRLFLSEPAPLAAIPDQALFAFSLPPHAFLLTLHFEFTAKKQVASLLRRRAPPRSHSGAHPSYHTKKYCCIVVIQGIHPNFRRAAKRCITREASLALVTPSAHLSALKLALFLSHPSNLHSAVFTA